MDKIKGRWDFRLSWWLIFATMASIFLISLLVGFFITDKTYYIFTLLAEMTIIFPITAGMILNIKRNEQGDLGFRGFSLKLLPFVIILPLIAQPFINMLTLPVTAGLNLLFDIGEQNLPSPANPLEFTFAILALCVAAPILEEILCRGLIMGFLKKHGVIVALIVSSLGFSMMHFAPNTIVIIFFLGMILGVIRLFTNSIWPCIIAHSVNNLFAFLGQLAPENLVANGIFIGISCVLFPIAFYFFLKFSKKEDIDKIQREKKAGTGVSVGAILSFALYGFYALLVILMKVLEWATGIGYGM